MTQPPPPPAPAAAAAAASSSLLLLAPPPGGCPCAPTFRAATLHWQRYSLPLAKPLTNTTAAAAAAPAATATAGGGGSSSGSGAGGGLGRREGLLLRLQLTWPDGRLAGAGVGEVAPLPGLHRETLQQAEVQVRGGVAWGVGWGVDTSPK